jgi:calcineurin-like phosphoesterase
MRWCSTFTPKPPARSCALRHFVDGRASFVVGTHTHVPTADAQILNGGTAYLIDSGMCGDYDSSIGMDKEEPVNRFVSKIPKGRFEVASGPATVCGVAVEISDRTGLAERIAPLRIGPRLAETYPEFWSPAGHIAGWR